MNLNHVTLTGILERDPITRVVDHGRRVSFTLRLTEAGPARPDLRAIRALRGV